MSDSEQCSNRLELYLSSVGHSILPDESALIMQVVLKIYVDYNDKLFGIFQWFHRSQISCLDGLIKHGTLYTAHSITCIMWTPSQQSA